MTTLKIKRFSTKQLHVEEDFGFQKQVQAEAKAAFYGGDSESPDEISLLAEGRSSALLDTTLGSYNAAVDGLDKALKESDSIPAASTAANADTQRDIAWRGANTYVKAMTAHPAEATRTVAMEAKSLFDKYGDPTNKAQTEESGVLHNLIQDLQALPAEKRTALALDAWIADMEAKEKTFLAAVQQRTSEQSTRIVGIVKQSRLAVDEAYDKLVETVNALVLLEGETTYAPFIDHVNVLIDRQKTVLKARSTLNAKKAAARPETPPEETK